MKIFSWVHKTFRHNSAHKGGLYSSKVRKAEPDVMNWDNNNNQTSLKEVALADVAGGWKDGFLTIGTLGCYGPFNFKSSDSHKHYLALESDEEEAEKHGDDDEKEVKYFDSDEHDEEMMKPLIIGSKFENKFEHVVNEKPNVAKLEALVTTPTPMLVSDDDVVECIDVGTDEKEKEECERITLADLFLDDSEKIIKHDEAAKALLLDDDDDDKQSLKAKHGQPAFAKKLISRVTKDNPHPIKSIGKLMKKMIKKKIHPDVDVKNEKSEEQKLSAIDQICENQKIEGTSG